MLRFSVLLVLVLCAGRGTAAAQSSDIEAAIDTLTRPAAEQGVLSGVLLVARGDAIIFEGQYGFADWEQRSPNTPSTVFGIGSITKPMTAIVVDRLVRDGRLELERTVESYLPGFPRGPQGGAPTVGDLLTHRAGVPHRVTDAADELHALTTVEIVERVMSSGLLFEPGAQRQYSSAGYTCLARVVEVVEGRPFEAVLEEIVLAPAGMDQTVSAAGDALISMRAAPYRLGADANGVAVKHAPSKDLRFLTGAGSVYSTAGDLLRLVLAVRDGVFGDALWASSFGGDDTARWVGWTGRTNGYEASVDVLPSEHLVIVFLTNLQSSASWQVREGVQAILIGGAATPISPPPAVVPATEAPESLVGVYGPAEITFVDGSLFRGENEFYPTADGAYFIPASGTSMRFRRTADGVVDALISISPSGHERVLEREDSE